MSEINSNNYKSFTGSFVPIRDDNNNLLSITSSNIPTDDESQFIELSSSYSYYSTSSLAKLIDINFSELTITNEGQVEIPSGSFIANQSDYQWLLDRILNLEEDLISSQSLFENELEIAYAENSSLQSTVKSVSDAALNITNDLIKKYEKLDPNVVGDLAVLKYIWFKPFDDIITNHNIVLKNKETYYLDISQSGAPGLGLVPTTIQRTEVSYSLAYDGTYLQNLFSSYNGEQLTIAALLGKISELQAATRSLQDQINILENQLYLCKQSSGSSGMSGTSGQINVGSLGINITTPSINGIVETYKDFEISFISDMTDKYNNLDLMQPYAHDGVYDRQLLQPEGKTKILFYKLVAYPLYDNHGEFIKNRYQYDLYQLTANDVASLVVTIDGVRQQPFIINDENLKNLSFNIQKGKSTTVNMVTNPSAWKFNKI